MAARGHFIIGTAGHVDHGKTALIRALTGTETDRLPEERQRGISIELGFAALSLGNGQVAGVVDVPGHERFIPQMLSGVAGLDLVLLVVDANEGVMPQTREHLQIMQLLQLRYGILVLTKCDLAEADWLDIVEEELRGEVSGTFLADAPCFRVSALSGSGLTELLAEIRRQLAQATPRSSSGAVRLPVDRCFSVSGFGTVVTGTLNSGRVQCGDVLEVLPAGVAARVREIQVHGRAVAEAEAGQRTALNLAGLSREQTPRGSVVGTPGLFRATQRIDVHLQLLAEAPRPLKFRAPVHLYLGTARSVARVILLDRNELRPGESTFVQLSLDRPLLAQRGDRFIIRSYSPQLTIGGGLLIDADPEKHKRFRPELIDRLNALATGELGFWLQKLDRLGLARIKELEVQTGSGRKPLLAGLEQLRAAGQVDLLAEQWVPSERLRSWQQRLPQLVADYLRQQPLRHGMPRATLLAGLEPRLAPKGFELLLQRGASAGTLQLRGELVTLPGWQPQVDAEAERILRQLADHFLAQGFQVKNCNESLKQLGLERLEADLYVNFLVQEGILVRLNQESYLHREHYQMALDLLLELLQHQEGFTLAEFRDRIASGRKLTQALLEYFDGCKYTRRNGEARVAWQLSGAVKSEK